MAASKRGQATTKKNTAGRTSQGVKRSRNTSSNSRTSSASANSRRAANTRSRSKSNSVSAETKEEVIVFILFALFVFILLCMINVVKGFIGEGVKHLMLGVFGLLGYFIPLCLLVGFLFKLSNKRNPIASIKLASFITLVFVIGIIICQVSGLNVSSVAEGDSWFKDLYEAQEKGGIVFGILACLLYKALGNAGTWFICIILAIICILLISEKNFLKNLLYSHNPFNRDEYDYDDDINDDYEYYGEEIFEGNAQRKRKLTREEIIARDEAERQKAIEQKKKNYELRLQREEEARQEKEREKEEKRKLIEEKRKAAEEKEREKEKIKDLKDDQRILNTTIKGPVASFNAIGVNDNIALLEEKKKISKDDIHEITIPTTNLSEEAIATKPEVYDNVILNDDKKSILNNNAEKTVENENTIDPYNNSLFEEKIISNIDSREENSSDNDFDEFEIKPIENTIKNTIKNPIETDNSESNIQNNISDMPDPVTSKSHAGNEKPDDKPVVVPKEYKYPSFNLLKENKNKNAGDTDEELKLTAFKLQSTLKTFGVEVQISDISQGPSVTRYELTLKEGTKVSKIVGLQDDIKLNLAAEDIRIEAPIPGKAAVGIEIPNKSTSPVLIRDLLETKEFDQSESKITFAVGKDISGKTIVADIAKMPHMLIAGSTGSGKSVCINTLIMSILYKADPKDVKLIMVDPKVVELSVYNGIPHLLLPVVTDPRKASAALQWAVNEMSKRYKAFANFSVRDLKGYNQKIIEMNKRGESDEKPKPQIVVIVDELADLMMVASKEVEESICRLAQLARAAGIHLIIATQRPSVDVITGLIKANMPSRVAFKVSNGVDSRTILDMVGAEKLLGKGDMLFYPTGYSKPLRTQGAFVSDDEVMNVVEFLKSNAGDNVYDEEVEAQISGITNGGSGNSNNSSSDKGSDVDPYFAEAGRLVIEKEKASSGMLQRVYKIGFNRAARIIDQLESYGVVGEEEGTKPRRVLMSISEFEDLLESIN